MNLPGKLKLPLAVVIETSLVPAAASAASVILAASWSELSALKLLTAIPGPNCIALVVVRLVPVRVTLTVVPCLSWSGLTDVRVGSA